MAVRAAAEDTERLRRIVQAYGVQPRHTLLHGQSWSAGVAAKGAEMLTGAPGARPYDAVLPTSGVLGGGTRSHDLRLDLRVLYQHLVQAFAEDTDPGGRIPVPVLNVHALHDPIAFVDLQHASRETMRAAGTADRLVQTYTEDFEHSCLGDPQCPALLQQLLAWVTQGTKPTQPSVAEACTAAPLVHGAGCRMVVGFEPLPLASRVTPRQRP